jgi:hypothetical protein
MNWQLSLIILLVGFLLTFHTKQQKTFRPAKSIKKNTFVQLKGQSDLASSLALAFSTGTKDKRVKKQMKTYQKLYLAHLFTPSGLHLIPFISLIRALFVHSRWWQAGSLFASLLFILQFNSLFSIKRLLALRFGMVLFPFFTTKFLFILVFLADYFWGSYQISPLSFSFSLLFLSCFVFSNDNEWPVNLIWANLLLCLIYATQFNFLYFVIGLVLSWLFTFLYPFIFFSFWLPSSQWIGFYLSSLFHKTVVFFTELDIPSFLSLEICALLFLSFFKLKFLKINKLVICLLFLINPLPINTFFKQYQSENELKTDKKCYKQFKQGHWLYQCRIKKL